MKRLLSMILVLLALPTMAQEAQQLEVTTIVQKVIVVTDENGQSQKKLVATDIVSPGDTVFYTITFKNVGDEAADNVVITNPIAASLSYVADSAFGPGSDVEFSVDDGQTFANYDELTVTVNGEVRAAVGSDFTHVRWVMQNDLAAGAQGIVRFAAILE